MKYILSLFFAFLTSLQGHGDEPKPLDLSPHLHAMQTGNDKASKDTIETKETEVEISGTRYRRIEYQNQLFYLRLQNSMTGGLDDEAYCKSPASIADPERLVEAAVKITKHTRLFIEGLAKKCGATQEMQPHMSLVPAPLGGIAITPKDGLEKKVFINPGINGAGFSSQF